MPIILSGRGSTVLVEKFSFFFFLFFEKEKSLLGARFAAYLSFLKARRWLASRERQRESVSQLVSCIMMIPPTPP